MDDFCGLDWGTLVAEQEKREGAEWVARMPTDEQFHLLLWILEVRRAIEAMDIKRSRLSFDFVRRVYFGGQTAWRAARIWSQMPGQELQP